MPKITVPAVRIEQDGKVLYLTRFTVADLITPGFYGVPELVAGGTDRKDEGFQRALDEKRAQKFARYIDDVGVETFLPTSLFLATSEEVAHDAATGAITFETSGDKSRPFFFMVDGQHRAAGLKKAAEHPDKHWLMDFPVPAVIASGLNSTEQMVQFLIVNTTQKNVSTDVAQQILAQFTREDGVEEMPSLPKIILDKMRNVDKALDLVEHLNSSPDSPWQGKIRMANQPKEAGTTTNQKTLVDSLNKFVLTPDHSIALEEDGAKRCKILTNYWTAVAEQFAPSDAESMDIPLFKTAGIDIFHWASPAVFKHLERNAQPRTAENFRACFLSAREFIDDEFGNIYAPDFWQRGGIASGFNKGSSRKYADALSKAVKQIPRKTGTQTE